MVEIPHYESPERLECEAAEAKVSEKVRELSIDLDLDRHPEVRGRLVEIGTHFEDSLDIARLLRTLYAELKDELELSQEGPERIMRAAVLHDVGKSGPAGEKGPFHAAVRRLFVNPKKRFSPYADGRAKSVAGYLAEQELPAQEEILAGLKEAGIDAATESMIDFWRRHAAWTYDILRVELAANPTDIDEETIRVAASHHLLEGQNPAGLDLARVPPDAQTLEILEHCEMVEAIDKYQALRVRGGMNHADAMTKLRAIFAANKDYSPLLREKSGKVIDIIERSEAAMADIFRKE